MVTIPGTLSSREGRDILGVLQVIQQGLSHDMGWMSGLLVLSDRILWLQTTEIHPGQLNPRRDLSQSYVWLTELKE